MKKISLILYFLFIQNVLNAQDIIKSTLLDNVMPVTQFHSGETKIALLDSIVQIGKTGKKSIIDLQFGFSGETKPKSDETTSANFVGGGFFKVSSLINPYIDFPSHWEFLKSLEHGGFLNYDWREKIWVGGYQIGLSFDLNPK